jgi:ankyrin repeat protein
MSQKKPLSIPDEVYKEVKTKLTIDFLKKHPHYDINQQYGSLSYTLLMIAAKYNDQDLVKFLLKKKNINTRKKNKFGETVLVFMIRNNNREMIKLLSNDMYSDKININDYQLHRSLTTGWECYGPALSYAIEKKDPELVKLILNNKNVDVNINININKGLPIDFPDLNNFSPMNILCLSDRDDEITNLILEYNKKLIDIYEKKNSKVTLWDYITQKN